MARRRIMTSARAPGYRPPKAWFGQRSPTAATTIASGAFLQLLGAVPGENDETVLRQYFDYEFTSSADAALPVGDYDIGVGVAVVSDAAFAAGTASMPNPITDGSFDGWVYYRRHIFRQRTDAGTTDSYCSDTKAMRIVETGSTLALIVGNGVNSVGSIRIQLFWRILSQLSSGRR